MSSLPQRTLRKAVHFTGYGLHSGQPVKVTLAPAPANWGIRFHRQDIAGEAAWISAGAAQVADTRLCTQIVNEAGVAVATIEHLMAALHALGIDNLSIALDAPEMPAMDGSAAPFLSLLQSGGLEALAAPRRALKVLEVIEVSDGDRKAALYPYDGALFEFSIDFDHPAIGQDSLSFDLLREDFAQALSRARTFGFLSQLEALRQTGRARGGAFDNAVVLDARRVLNPEGLRYADEFVRHKLLDAIGDTYIEGLPLIGHYVGHKAGHALTSALMQSLLSRPSAWEITEALDALDSRQALPLRHSAAESTTKARAATL